MTTQRLPAHPDDPLARARTSPPVGPTAHVTALPVSRDLDLSVPSEVDAHLSQIEEVRQRQLDALPSVSLDAVSAAHRRRVEQILDDVRAARGRLAAGLYGSCVACAGAISAERLEVRPWATACSSCASGDRS
jgi:DnaK suppressor protein